jgi:predicted metalloprotease with PDZ domain
MKPRPQGRQPSSRLAAGLVAMLLALLNPCGLSASDERPANSEAVAPGVQHQLSFPELHLQYLQVESRFPATGSYTELLLPVWTPGSYQVINHDAAIDGFSAEDEHGRPLAVSKPQRDLWRIASAGAETVHVRYRAHASGRSVSQSWVSPDYVLLNFSNLLMYSEASRDLPQWLRAEPAAGLSHAYSALPAAGGQRHWRAASYDELVDSPLVMGNNPAMRFDVDGHGYALVQVGDDRAWDREQLLTDIRAVIAAHNRFWGVLPLTRDYWIFNLLNDAAGGLEHDYSTVLMSKRWQMRNRNDYVAWLSLLSHEYFHVWNVRRMRPLELARYHYRAEQHSPSLWLAEGFTSYYDDLLLSRARVVTPAEYLQRLARNLHALELTPGRLQLPMQQSSMDAWTRYYQQGSNSINAQASYYTQGAVVAFVLDAQLRERSRGRHSLDDVMRAMFARWGEQAYPPEALALEVERLGGVELRDWLQPLLDTTAQPDVDAALDWYGLALQRHPEKAALEAAGGRIGAGFGINFESDPNRLLVASVVHGLAAASAGILPGDELLAVNEQRVLPADFDGFKARLRPGESVDVLLARQGRLLRLTVQAGEARPLRYEIRGRDNFGSRELKRLQDWLGQPLAQ